MYRLLPAVQKADSDSDSDPKHKNLGFHMLPGAPQARAELFRK
jgi:hypothetical protein